MKDSKAICFTSALYLGLDHASRTLPAWDRLTLGKPAALEEPPGAGKVEKRLAALIGCERALLATSTLHLFWDLFGVLGRRKVNIFLDSGSYPIIRWGVERAGCSGTVVKSFRQHDPEDLNRVLRRDDGKTPIIVADGYCPGCGKPAPLAEYLAQAEARGGFVVVDDSQALGIFGRPAPSAAYGTGGGGSMQRSAINSDRLIIGSSLAKAFGVPVAVLAGSAAILDEFERESATRVHCSPPSAAAIGASIRALGINWRRGDTLRSSLAQLVCRFRGGLEKLGLIAIPGLFPVQPLRLPGHIDPYRLHQELENRGVEAVLHRRSGKAAISFVITARHSAGDIDQALTHLATGMRLERN